MQAFLDREEEEEIWTDVLMVEGSKYGVGFINKDYLWEQLSLVVDQYKV